jgi:3-methyladenine DNA glycosylase AlkD
MVMRSAASRSALVVAATTFVTGSLEAEANPEKAVGMQAYMRTEMPFFGVQKPARVQIARRLIADFPPADRTEYEALVLGLWDLPHREEKYLALDVACRHRAYVDSASLPLYRRLILEGAWWDFVDDVATHLIRDLVLEQPEETWPEVETWIDSPDMWLRRSAIICQVGAKERTDSRRLFAFCEARLDEKEFFIRKAIGWALREYAKTDPEAVAGFVEAHRDRFSGLSFREATKHIGHLVS